MEEEIQNLSPADLKKIVEYALQIQTEVDRLNDENSNLRIANSKLLQKFQNQKEV